MTDEQFNQITEILTRIRQTLEQIETNTSDTDDVVSLLKDIKKSTEE